tara:strand:- start:4214 stop:4906 length:693 start_codon:yes stop_codon:yes gene_type:complete
MSRKFVALLSLLFILGSCVATGNYQRGLDAYNQNDYSTALLEWKTLAEQGNRKAQFFLGQMYFKGLGVSKNIKNAFKWFSLAAEQDDSVALNNLGVMYDKGLGVLQDFKIASNYFELSAERGYALGQNNLGKLYYFGRGVPRDFKKAFKLFELAAKNEFANAQYNLGVMYEKGHGVKRDLVQSYKWYDIAFSLGYRDALKRMVNVKRRLTHPQLVKAEQLSFGWLLNSLK